MKRITFCSGLIPLLLLCFGIGSNLSGIAAPYQVGNDLAEGPLPGYMVNWTQNGVPICTVGNSSSSIVMISDGAGGAILVWTDARVATDNLNIYAQRIDALGIPLWGANGTPICTYSTNQQSVTLISDGAGGAVILWRDERNGAISDIYAQKVNSAGQVQWSLNGVRVSNGYSTTNLPLAVSDGAGGAIVAWYDVNYDIYAQRINSSGNVKWTANGVGICTNINNQHSHRIVSDGYGGAIIAWQDNRLGNFDIYAQRINGNGVINWTSQGLSVCTASLEQGNLEMMPNGDAGAILVWEDARNGYTDIYTQCISNTGAKLWTTAGVPVCTEADYQDLPRIVTDDAGGAYITWEDNRNGADYDIYAQRLNSAGVPQWIANGTVVSNAGYDQYNPAMASDGSDGLYIDWRDYRTNVDFDIYAQKLYANGTAKWDLNGEIVCNATNDQRGQRIISDGTGNAIIAWEDERASSNPDIYAQLVEDRDPPTNLSDIIPDNDTPDDDTPDDTTNDTVDDTADDTTDDTKEEEKKVDGFPLASLFISPMFAIWCIMRKMRTGRKN